MSGVALKGDWLKLKDQLKRLELEDNDKRRLNKLIVEQLRSSTLDRFDAQESPDGTPWEPLAESTIEKRKKASNGDKINILIDSGVLQNSITLKALASGAAVGTNLVYGAIQQFGGPAGRKTKKTGKDTHEYLKNEERVNIPARQYLGVSREDEHEILGIIEEFMEDLKV